MKICKYFAAVILLSVAACAQDSHWPDQDTMLFGTARDAAIQRCGLNCLKVGKFKVDSVEASGSVTVGTTVLVPANVCSGSTTQNRDAVQTYLTSYAGKTIVFPEGLNCAVAAVTDKTKFLTVGAGTRIKGAATFKVADATGSYDSFLYSTDCTGCDIRDITIDDNVANNRLVNVSEIAAHPRNAIHIASGSGITVSNVTVKNTSALNNVNIVGSRITVKDSHFIGIGDDPDHVVHDVSVLYLVGPQITVTGNFCLGASRGAPSAYNCVETHGSGTVIANNNIRDMAHGINYTGGYSSTSMAGSITGNVIEGTLGGISLWSGSDAGATGYGYDGVTVTGNSIRINQLDYADKTVWGNNTAGFGVWLATSNNLPAKNIRIADNIIIYDQENSAHTGDYAQVGIGGINTTLGYENVSIEGNIIDNAPVKGIGFSVASLTGLRIVGNLIRNAGSSLDSGISSSYKVPIYLLANSGVLQGEVSDNNIIDTFATSRMTTPIFLGASAVSGDLNVWWNSVSLTDATGASFTAWITLNDSNVQPTIKQIGALGHAWAAPVRTVRAGSTFFDRTTNTQYYLWADGTSWTTGFSAPVLTGTTSVNTPLIDAAAAFDIKTGGTLRWEFNAAGNIVSFSDGSYNIGGPSSGRPGTIYAKNLISSAEIAATKTSTPANSSAACNANTFWSDGSYIYYCIASGNIKRTAALATF